MFIPGALPKLIEASGEFCMFFFLSSADFFQNHLFLIQEYHLTVSNSLDPDQARHFVGPKLGPNSVCKGYEQMTLVGKE